MAGIALVCVSVEHVSVCGAAGIVGDDGDVERGESDICDVGGCLSDKAVAIEGGGDRLGGGFVRDGVDGVAGVGGRAEQRVWDRDDFDCAGFVRGGD